MNKKIYIVGEKIKQQLNLKYLYTYNEFVTNYHQNIDYYLGQGLSRYEIYRIIELTQKLSLKLYIGDCKLITTLKICNMSVHKKNIKNVIVSVPEIINHETYKSFLVIDQNCAEMSDHISGLHVQGMVLIEAARQMVNAIGSVYFIKNEQTRTFILNSITAEFNQYVFPLSVEILCNLKILKQALYGNLSGQAEIQFIQDKIIKSTIIINFQIMDANIIKNYESHLLFKYLNKDAMEIKL
jgi:hypothetical protein